LPGRITLTWGNAVWPRLTLMRHGGCPDRKRLSIDCSIRLSRTPSHPCGLAERPCRSVREYVNKRSSERVGLRVVSLRCSWLLALRATEAYPRSPLGVDDHDEQSPLNPSGCDSRSSPKSREIFLDEAKRSSKTTPSRLLKADLVVSRFGLRLDGHPLDFVVRSKSRGTSSVRQSRAATRPRRGPDTLSNPAWRDRNPPGERTIRSLLKAPAASRRHMRRRPAKFFRRTPRSIAVIRASRARRRSRSSPRGRKYSASFKPVFLLLDSRSTRAERSTRCRPDIARVGRGRPENKSAGLGV